MARGRPCWPLAAGPLVTQLLAAIAVLFAPTPTRAQLPPPPREVVRPSVLQLRLELLVNEAPTGAIVPVQRDGQRFLVDAADLRAAYVPLPPDATGPIDVTALPRVRVEYRQESQQLALTVPLDWLPGQTLHGDGRPERVTPESNFGAVLNYDLYVARSTGGQARASLWNDARVFGPFGVVRTTGVYDQPLSGGRSSRGPARFTRFDTNWTRVDDERALTFEGGDLVTRTLPWAGAVRLGGVQISRDFSVRPDIVTYPLPVFSGSAAVPSSVDLFINGNRATGGAVDPGPFTLGDVPYVNGAGQAVVVTTDAQGRRVATSTPFYVANTLLRQGLDDFAFAAGALRRDYGRRNFAYGALAANGAWRHGLTSWLTLEAQGQIARSLALAGGGAAIRVGNLGVVDLSGAASRHQGKDGSQIESGYQYNGRRFNIAARHTRRRGGFTDLGAYDFPDLKTARAETRVNGSYSLPRNFGTLGGSYIDTRRGNERFRLTNVSYFRSLWRNASMLMTVNRELESRRTTALLQLVMTLGHNGTAVGGVDRDGRGNWRQSVGYSRPVPSDGGIGYRADFAHSGGSGNRYVSEMTWRTQAAQVQGGAYGGGGSHTQWVDVSGAVVAMGGGVFASNRISDAFVLVSADGVAGVPVLHENQRIGVTDRRGFALVPSVAAYQSARFAIDPLDLPADIHTPVVEHKAAVTLGGGRFVRFEVRKAIGRIVVLHDPQGRPLKPGTAIATDDGQSARVGWDGQAYIPSFPDARAITATLGDGTRCTARLTPPRAAAGPVGPLPCL